MANFLRFRRQYYYLRLRVPTDLRRTFPETEILKSLHTKDRKSASLSASRLHSNILEVFTLTRAGFISPEQARTKLDTLLSRKVSEIPPQPMTLPLQIVEPPPAPSLAAVITQYTKDRESAWTPKTLLEYGGYFRLIQDILGQKTATDIGRDDVRQLRDTLSKLPANLYKKYPGKTVAEVLKVEKLVPMSTTTVNKLLTIFGSLMRHCIKEGYRKDNPTEGLRVKQLRRAEEERKAYSRSDLSRLITALPSPATKPERYWVPLIGLYSGMRLGEICGLHVADIKQVDGIWCFDVNEDGEKRLKTLASNRIVPIHPELVRRGLMELVESAKAQGNERLWPNLVRREIDGYCHALGNWYGRFNRKNVTHDTLKSFHSLRHTFADSLKQLGEQEVVIAELMGHSNASITTGRYGKRYKPEILLEAIRKLTFDL